MASRLVLSASVALAACSLIACALVADLELPKFVAGGEAGTGDGAAGSDAATAWDPCNPTLPEQGIGSSADEIEKHTFAVQYAETGLRSTIVADKNRLCPESAIDLDGIATCSDGPNGKVPGSCAPRGGNKNCDLAGGGDNATSGVIQIFSGAEADPRDDPNPVIERGGGGMLLELAGYNGQDDDN